MSYKNFYHALTEKHFKNYSNNSLSSSFEQNLSEENEILFHAKIVKDKNYDFKIR